MYKAKKDDIALLMSVAVFSTTCFSCIDLNTMGFEKLGGGNVTPIEREYLEDEDYDPLLDENDNYITE